MLTRNLSWNIRPHCPHVSLVEWRTVFVDRLVALSLGAVFIYLFERGLRNSLLYLTTWIPLHPLCTWKCGCLFVLINVIRCLSACGLQIFRPYSFTGLFTGGLGNRQMKLQGFPLSSPPPPHNPHTLCMKMWMFLSPCWMTYDICRLVVLRGLGPYLFIHLFIHLFIFVRRPGNCHINLKRSFHPARFLPFSSQPAILHYAVTSLTKKM